MEVGGPAADRQHVLQHVAKLKRQARSGTSTLRDRDRETERDTETERHTENEGMAWQS